MSVLRWTERLSYRLADAVIATNESYRRVALTRGRVAADRVFVVRNGPREGWPLAVEPDPSLKRGRPLLVVYMGVMGYQDGVDQLLDVVHALVHGRGFRDATFALVGDGNAYRGPASGRRGSWASRSSSTSPAGSRTRRSCPATS